MPKLCVILNPWSGRGMGAQKRPELERELRQLGVDFALVETHGRGGATELTYQALSRGFDQIAAGAADDGGADSPGRLPALAGLVAVWHSGNGGQRGDGRLVGVGLRPFRLAGHETLGPASRGPDAGLRGRGGRAVFCVSRGDGRERSAIRSKIAFPPPALQGLCHAA